jgi:hypothetical protein
MKRLVTVLSVLIVIAGLATPPAMCEERNPAYAFTFSGYFKADAVYDRARVNAGNYALYVLDKPENDVMSVTARETRLGLDFAWKENDIKTAAKLEFDFYGLGVSSATLNSQENKATSMLRHAYLQLTRGHWSILAGQTSDIMSPLVPKTVNYTVCWDQGNIGYRRPQFRVSGWVDAADNIRLTATAGAARTLGGDVDGDKVDDGADAAVPTAEGRLGLGVKLAENESLDIGFSGHYGTEEYQVASTKKDVASWSGNVDLKLSLNGLFELAGEFFTGQDLGAYYGGVGQTVNLLKQEIRSKGGWGQLSIKPTSGLWLNVGYGLDDPDAGDFEIPADSTLGKQSFIDLNAVFFASVFYDVTSTVTAMLEVSQLKTDYLYKIYAGDALRKSSNSYDDLRIQFALKAAIK